MNEPPPADELLQRLRRFKSDYFPHHQQRFQDLVAQGQHPKTLFIGCSDSRLVPYLLTDAAPGELFIVRNVGARAARRLRTRIHRIQQRHRAIPALRGA